MDDRESWATPPTIIKHDDVDAYQAALASWDVRAVPLDRGDFELRWVERELPGMSIVRYSTALSMREEYVKEPGSTAIVLVLPRSSASFRVGGAAIEPMTLTLLHSEVEYEVISPSGGETLEIYVPDRELAASGLDRWLDTDVPNVRPTGATAEQLIASLSPLVTPDTQLANRPDAVRAQILDVLDAALDTVDTSMPPLPTVRLHGIYRRAMAAIDEEADLMLTVVELARRLEVSTRALRYAFGHALGISPYQYLLRRRLAIARQALLDPSRAEQSVLAVLLDLGITHQGEFAGQYRRSFGESPSQTRPGRTRWHAHANPATTWPRIR